MSESVTMEGAVCTPPISQRDRIVMGHGSGGKLLHDLIAKSFLPPFDNPALRAGDDAGVVQINTCTQMAISTDSHVVWPLFFPGGDIGRLAVCGTVNDVAMMGATPMYLSAGFILEEGLDLETLQRVVESMRAAAEEAGVQIVAGDTKVVQKGKADGLYINTAGVGLVPVGIEIGGALAEPGDVVILSGPIGDHGIAALGAVFQARVLADLLVVLVAGEVHAQDGVVVVGAGELRGRVGDQHLHQLAHVHAARSDHFHAHATFDVTGLYRVFLGHSLPPLL